MSLRSYDEDDFNGLQQLGIGCLLVVVGCIVIVASPFIMVCEVADGIRQRHYNKEKKDEHHN